MLYEAKILCCNTLIYLSWKMHAKTAFLGTGMTHRTFLRSLYPNGQDSPFSLGLQEFPIPIAKTWPQSLTSTCPGDLRVAQSKGTTFCLEIAACL